MFITRLISMAFAFVMPFFVYGQVHKIKGFVKDSNKNVLSNATIIVNDIENNNVLAYDVSKKNGHY